MDRALFAVLRLPLPFPEESISLKVCLPRSALQSACHEHIENSLTIEFWKIHTLKICPNPVSKHREVHRVLHLKGDTPRLRQSILATSISDMTIWITDINSSLEEWYMMAQKAVPKEVLLFRHFMYSSLKAKIYPPTPRIPLRSPSEVQIYFDLCQNIIDSVTDTFECAAIIQPCQTLHIVFRAAVILLDACWQYRSQVLMRSAASHVVSVVIPKSFELIDEVGRWWSRAQLCSTCLQPMLAEVARPYICPYPGVPGSSAADEATTKKTQGFDVCG